MSPYAGGVELSPTIAVSPNAFPAVDRHFYKFKPLEYGEGSMAESVLVAGGLPLMAYRAGLVGQDEICAHAREVMRRCDGLLLTGGSDIAPEFYGETPRDLAWAGDPVRDRWEIALYRAAVDLERPVLGVCRGMQLINVAEGGSLWQDLVTMREGSQTHRSQELYDELLHGISVAPGSFMESLFEGLPLEVNSVHHQGVRTLGAGLDEVAWAPDGVIEGVVRRGTPWVVGVQWHPEWRKDDVCRRLFHGFVGAARMRVEAP